MQYTTNYGFKKPEDNEAFDQQAHANYNMDAIDTALTPTADPAQVPTGNGPGKLVQWVSWLANRIKAITGKTNWYDAPDTTLAAAKTHIDAAAPHTGHETPAGAQAKVDAHAALTNNPHAVTKAQVGLGNVDDMNATAIREATDRGLRVEVRDSYPDHAQGKIIFHTGENKFKGSTGAEWL